MNFDWTPYFIGFWTFPLFCLLLMAVMMIACRGMRFRCGHDGSAQRSQREDPPDPAAPHTRD